MPVEVWSIDRAGDLAELYNTCTASIPYVFPIDRDRLSRVAQTQHEGVVENDVLIVGTEAGRPAAFAHIGELVRNDPDGIPDELREFYTEGGGLIRTFLSDAGTLAAAQDVLMETEDYLKKRGHRVVWAFDDTSYHLYRYATGHPSDYWPYAWLTDCQPHALPLLRTAGYTVTQKGTCLHWPEFSVGRPSHDDPELESRVTDVSTTGDRPSVRVQILREDDVVSEVSISPLELSAPYASHACYIDGCGTAENHRRQGYGRYALQVALSEMRDRGFRHAVLDVEAGNNVAHLLYLRMGFRELSGVFSAKKCLE